MHMLTITRPLAVALTLQRIDETTLDGAFANGRPAKLVRQ
jgi:hypothetical protein